MHKSLYIAAALTIAILTLAEAVPASSGYLPPGGSHIYQLGIVLGSFFAIHEGHDLWRETRKAYRRWKRRHRALS